MGKYIINHSIEGYEKSEIGNTVLVGKDNIVILVLDESTSDRLIDYYDSLIKIMVSGAKVFIIIVGKESKIRKSICILAANYRNYNIYKVDSKNTITKEYINTIIDREPTIDEVQSFVGGDISGYSDISTILLGIDDLISHGDMEGLKGFIEGHINSIENLTSVIDYMKKIVDNNSSNELMDRINELQQSLKDLTEKFEQTEAENNKIKDENLKLQGDSETAKKTLSKVMSEKQSLEKQLSSSGPVIQTYSEIKTNLIKCKTSSIIYFKEISYVRYVNSFVMNLLGIIKLNKNNVKMIIYDTNVGINTYGSLNIVSGNDFLAGKRTFLTKVEVLVAVEPNQAILTTILESINPEFDVVIVYDRMKKVENIVEGNNVVKYYVINSNKDFEEASKKLKITDKSMVITRPECTIGPEALNIPEIENYTMPKTTDAARLSKYKRLQSAGSNKLLFDTILEKARIGRK